MLFPRVFELFVAHGLGLNAGKLHRLVELLQIVDQEMRPGAIDGLLPADNAFLKIKPTLPPAKDFRDCLLAFQRTINGMTNSSLLQINLTVATAGFKGETPAALAQATHLQNLGGRELIQITDERVTGIDSFSRGRGSALK